MTISKSARKSPANGTPQEVTLDNFDTLIGELAVARALSQRARAASASDVSTVDAPRPPKSRKRRTEKGTVVGDLVLKCRYRETGSPGDRLVEGVRAALEPDLTKIIDNTDRRYSETIAAAARRDEEFIALRERRDREMAGLRTGAEELSDAASIKAAEEIIAESNRRAHQPGSILNDANIRKIEDRYRLPKLP